MPSSRNRTAPTDRIQQRFEAFHTANPSVYRHLVGIARKVKNSGMSSYGIGPIFERLRWYFQFETSGDKFKLNNDFRSRYARLVMSQESDLEGFFRVRALHS